MARIDVHQHLWLPELLDALRARTRLPRLVGWTLQIDGEPDYEIDPAGHQPEQRAAQDADELPVNAGEPWTSRKKQRREARIAEAKAREQTTVRPPEVHVERGADPHLKVRLGDI